MANSWLMQKRGVLILMIASAFLSTGLVDPAMSAPTNDNLAAATSVPGVPFFSQRDTATATMQTGEQSCFAATGRSVWYKLVLNENPIGTFGAGADDTYVRTNNHNVAVVAHTLGSNYDTTISIFDGSPGAANKVGCSNDVVAGVVRQSSFTLTLVSGHVYYISVASAGPGGGTLKFSLDRVPLNDYFGEAYDASLPVNRFVTSNVGAVLETFDPRNCLNMFNTLWYKRRGSVNHTVHLDSVGSTFQTAIAVWQQNSDGTFSSAPIACGGSQVDFTATAGVTYLFQVGGANGAVGGLVLNIEKR